LQHHIHADGAHKKKHVNELLIMNYEPPANGDIVAEKDKNKMS
jgi:hypothetical protein